MNLSHPLRLVLIACVVVTLSGCSFITGWLQDRRDETPGIQMQALKAEAGSRVELFASGLPKARHMALGAKGTLFVGSMAGNVYALTLQGGKVASQATILTGLTDPSGVAFADGALFVANRQNVLRFDDIESRLTNPPEGKPVLTGLPDKARHDAHAMRVGRENKLYVSVGAPCDTCEALTDEYGTIVRIALDGSAREVFARGIRNTVGLDFHPQTQQLWFTENGQDGLGAERPNDELNRVTRVGEHFGFPYCHDSNIADPKFGKLRACSEFTAPAFGLGAHVAALGMRFVEDGPAGGVSAIVARHGSHPPERAGYDVVRISFDNGMPVRSTPYLTGFLQGKQYWGRPVDVLQLKDGSVLISDDLNGAIYSVSRNR